VRLFLTLWEFNYSARSGKYKKVQMYSVRAVRGKLNTNIKGEDPANRREHDETPNLPRLPNEK